MVSGGDSAFALLAVGGANGLRWAALLARLRSSGRAMPIKDSLMAATALVHGLTMATRNRSDFASAGVKLVHPFNL
jgi:predicted nucleic acid-binding protein